MSVPPDPDSRAWLASLQAGGRERDRAVARLHALLLRVARAEALRRQARLPDSVTSDLEHICLQAASDAVLAVVEKLEAYRGAARFTTWASKFVILELSARLRRRAWREREVLADDAAWEALADASSSPLDVLERRELVAALRRAVHTELTERQRRVFQDAVLGEVPVDVLAERLGTTRGAVYKALHDARRRLRASLADAGYLQAAG